MYEEALKFPVSGE